MIKTLAQELLAEGLLSQDDAVVVAVSGGADSVALLHLLLDLNRSLGWKLRLHVAHLNHMLRGDEAEKDAAFVQAACDSLSIPCTIDRRDVAVLAETESISVEEAARHERYTFYERVCLQSGSRIVALGHQADDNAETVLHRILRGTGLRGLAGIPRSRPLSPDSDLRVIRPLLGVTRDSLRAYLADSGVAFREDRSNATSEPMRNRIRNEVLPMVREKVNPQASEALVRLAFQAQWLDEFLQETVQRTFETLIISRTDQDLKLNADTLSRKSRIVQTELVRRAYASFGLGEQDLSFNHLVSVLQLVGDPASGRQTKLPGGMTVEKRYHQLTFSRPSDEPREALAPDVAVHLPGRTLLPLRGLEIVCSIDEVAPGSIPRLRRTATSMEEFVDLDAVHAPLFVRSRRPGERFLPLGTGLEEDVRLPHRPEGQPQRSRPYSDPMRSTRAYLGNRASYRRSREADGFDPTSSAPLCQTTRTVSSDSTATSGTSDARPPSASHQVRRHAQGLTWRIWLLLFAAALGARAGWGTYRMVRASDVTSLEFPDEVQYWSMGESLRSGDGLTDELGFRATRMPLYPALLSVFAGNPNGIVFAKAAHWAIGALAAALAGALAATLGGRRVGLITGLIVAFDPFLIFFSSLLLTETLFIAALVGLWWAAWPVALPESAGRDTRRRWLTVGLIAALCIYLRPSSAGLILAMLGFLLFCRRFRLRACMGTLIAVSVVVACLFPWALRNKEITGERCWLTNRAGISLYDGVGPQATGDSNLGDIKSMPAVSDLDEASWNRYFMTASVRAMKEDPLRIARLGLVKVARTWNPLPNVRTYRSPLPLVISAAWTMSTFALAVAGAIILYVTDRRNGGRVVVFLLLPALYFTALHSLFVGSVRYRLPALPMLGILAALAIAAALGWARERRERPQDSEGRFPT